MIHITSTPPKSEHSRLRSWVFRIIGQILDKFEPLLKKSIDHTIEVGRYVLEVPELPTALENTQIIHISDLHFHENWEPDKMITSLLETLKDVKAKWKIPTICFTGDIVSKGTDFDQVKSNIAKFTKGIQEWFGNDIQIHACEGNHDMMRRNWLWETWEKAFLEGLGLNFSGKTDDYVHIISTPDFTTSPNAAKEAVKAAITKKDGKVNIILTHNLDVLKGEDNSPDARNTTLILSGHVHGGHVGLPDNWKHFFEHDPLSSIMARWLLGYKNRLITGMKRVGNIFMSLVGTGENEKRPRLGAPRTLHVIEFRSATSASSSSPK